MQKTVVKRKLDLIQNLQRVHRLCQCPVTVPFWFWGACEGSWNSRQHPSHPTLSLAYGLVPHHNVAPVVDLS